MIDDLIFCYQNAKGELLVLPIATPPRGPQTVINRPQRLQSETSAADFGAAIRLARKWCDYTLDDPNGPLPQLAVTGERSLSQFAKKWHLVTVSLGPTIEVTPAQRDKKGAYWFRTEQKVCLTGEVSDEVLGSTVREAFALCIVQG